MVRPESFCHLLGMAHLIGKYKNEKVIIGLIIKIDYQF